MSHIAWLSGKTALVTGSGRGIGKAIALQFAQAGAAVLVATRTPEFGAQTVEEIERAGGRAILATTTLSDRAEIDGLVETCLRHYGGLDILVHNAATIPVARVGAIDDAHMNAAFNINVKAAIHLSQAALAPMRARGEGRLLFTSTVTAQRVYPGCAVYSATKAALNGFIRAAALELGPERITVNGVEPGIIETDAVKKHNLSEEARERITRFIPLRRFGTADEVAAAMLFLASPAASYVTGQLIVVDGGTILPENGGLLG